LIFQAKKSDCLAVAELHLNGIGTGFLTRLGVPFLIKLYEAAQVSKHALLFVSNSEGGAIDGYISATVNTGKFYTDFLLSRYSIGAIPALFRFLLSSRATGVGGQKRQKENPFVKCLESLLYPFKKKQEITCEAELLSIVVDPEARGKGIADELLNELKQRLLERGNDRFKVVVGSENLRACRFYEKNGGRLAKRIEVHRGAESNVYVFVNQKNESFGQPVDQ